MSEKITFTKLPPERLRWTCNLDFFSFKHTGECEQIQGIIGQGRALAAIRMGLEISSPGYNIYASGLAGTGKTSTIKMLLKQLDIKKPPPDDICYIHNFKDRDMPIFVTLPAGMGKNFQQDMDDLITFLKKEIPKILESDDFKKASEEIIHVHRTKEKEMIRAFNEKLHQNNLQLVQFQIGPYMKQDVAPLFEGKPVPFEQIEALADQNKFDKNQMDVIRKNVELSRMEFDELMRQTREIEKKIQRQINALEHKFGLPVISGVVSDISMQYGRDNEKIEGYLNDVQEHILSNLKTFTEKEEEQQPVVPAGYGFSPHQGKPFPEYQVNVLVDNSHAERAPVIIETTPNYKNLFGTIERDFERLGFLSTDFTRIKAGSLLRANGGYIVFDAIDALIEPGVWEFLKRTLKNRLLTIQNYDPYSMTSTAMKPEPIPLDVKVIMIGDDHLYQRLYNAVEDFKKIFKIKAPFDTEMTNNKDNIAAYVSFIKKITEEECLLPFDKKAVAAVIEYGVRLTGHQNKVSTRFSDIADLIREASYWAQKDESPHVADMHVDKAIDERITRINLLEEKIQELIENGTIMIDTVGMAVGQVNGLSVYDLGDYAFGKPSRITAETSVGRSGVINIEREAKLSGKTHDKGVLILEGYIRGKYAQDKNLTMSASICFEQSYGEVDGDSASSSEVYAIFSCLSNLPLRQDIAVTGSVNQKGDIQPVGGVNLKIEGFYDVCKAKGITGTQGVMIPALNIPDLMLRKDVVQAVAEDKFHIYPVNTIDEGISILTGKEAGKINKDGNYPPDTINFIVNERLKTLAISFKEASEEKHDNPTKDK
ncbi:MAG: AAA family ATPase [Deltaproteobacteria bacterium]|nr:AAA family ATPase [Deltaproteobacteria bacterium]